MNPVIEIAAWWLALDIVLVAVWHIAHVLVRSKPVPAAHPGPRRSRRTDLRSWDLRSPSPRPQHPRVAFMPRDQRVLAHTSV